LSHNLFKKAVIFTDIHFGLKSNSAVHNEDCLAFVKWATKMAIAEGCETAMFLGDWHDNRANINIITLNYSLQALEHLNQNFSKVFFIPGNHDLYYRDKRDIQSVEWAKHLSNVVICNNWHTEGDVVFAPWLVQDDHEHLKTLKGKYLFGHFELPSFMMNAKVEMPHTSDISIEDMNRFESVFSGHFHMRQKKGNVQYIGNCFPHNFADEGDSSRGAMILEWGKQPVFKAWPDQPLYRVLKLSDVLEDTDKKLKQNMYSKVNIDIDISYEEALFIKETFITQYNLREMSLIPVSKGSVVQDLAPGDVKFESVDQIVTQQIKDIKSDFYDPQLLLDIYRTL